MRSIVLAALLGLACCGTAPGNLIINGSFEDPVLTPGQAIVLAGGSTAINGWTVLGRDVLLIQTTYGEPGAGVDPFNAQDGLNSVDLTGAGNTGPTDGIRQVVATTAGTVYDLSFYVGRADSSNGSGFYATPATVGLSIDGGGQILFTNADATPGRLDWKRFTYSFTATSAATTIAFFNSTPSQTSEAGLDNVSLVAAVPEPSTLALAASAAVLGLALRGRRSRPA